MEFSLWLLSFILLLLSFLTISFSPRKRRNNSLLPPGPKPLPFFGNLFSIGDQPHLSFARLAKLHGPIMTLKLGQTKTIVISSPEMAKEVLQKKDQSLCDRWVPTVVDVLDHPKGSLMWSPANQEWKQLRAICALNLFSNKCLEGNKEVRQHKVRELVDYVSAQRGRPVDVGKAVFSTLLNFLSVTLFSVDGEQLRANYGHDLKALMSTLTEEAGKPNISDFFPFLRAFDLQRRWRRTIPHLKTLYKLIDEVIDSRLTTGEKHSDFLDTLLQLHMEEKLERRVVKSTLTDLLVAGLDTTSITVEWAMTELLRNPTTLANAQTELKSVSQQVEESDIAQLPYLQAVVKEVMRLHPAGPFLLHKAVEDVGVEGYVIPKGTRVMVNVWAIGHDEQVWAEPEKFMPERFLNLDVDYRGRDFELIPFGSGRRICPGMPMAVKLTHLILASLLRSFNWRLEDGVEPEHVDMKEKFGATLAKPIPLRAVPVPIASC